MIYVEQRETRSEDLIRLPIDPNVLFEEVVFDPRLLPFERLEREETVRRASYTGLISASKIYQGEALEIIVPDDADRRA